jgi:hypothetical protein
MTVTLTSPYRIGIVAGTGVSTIGPVVPAITTDDIFNPDAPTQTLTQLLQGISSAKLVGSAIIDGTTVANIPLFAVPAGQILIPTEVVFALTDISGSGNPPAINLGFEGTFRDYIDSTSTTTYSPLTATPFAPGTGYVPGDVLTLTGGTHAGSAVTLTLTDTLLASSALNAPGTGYAPGDKITVSGGVAVTKAILAVATTKLVSTALNVAGTVYAPADTITLAGGTHSTAAILTVSTVKLVSAAIHSGGGGTGYGNTTTFNVTVFGGTAGTAAVVHVTTNSGGVVTTINSITTPGSYTVLPTLSGNAVTGDDGTDHGTGLSLDLVFGVNTFTVSTAGSYTVNSATFTQSATSGSGSGATFNAGLFGVNTFTIFNAGVYTTNGSTFTQFSTTGAGTGATFNTNLYGAQALSIIGGSGAYSILPANHVATTGGTGTGATVDMDWEIDTSAFAAILTEGQLLKIDNLTASSEGGDSYAYLPAGNMLTARVAFASTYATYTVMCFVFGFVTTAPA